MPRPLLAPIMQYILDPDTGALAALPVVTVTKGSGPRHIAFHPSGTAAFLVNELAATASTFAYSRETGLLSPGPTYVSTVPVGTSANGQHTAEVLVSPDGA